MFQCLGCGTRDDKHHAADCPDVASRQNNWYIHISVRSLQAHEVEEIQRRVLALIPPLRNLSIYIDQDEEAEDGGDIEG